MRGDESRRALLRVSELRMLMNVVTPSCHLVGDCCGSTIDFGCERWVGDDDLLSRRSSGEYKQRRKNGRVALGWDHRPNLPRSAIEHWLPPSMEVRARTRTVRCRRSSRHDGSADRLRPRGRIVDNGGESLM